MNSNNSIVPVEATVVGSSRSNFLDSAIKGASRRLEYLQGREAQVGNALRWLVFGIGGLFLWKNIDAITHFAEGVTDIVWQAIYASAGVGVLWAMWKIMGNETLRYHVAELIDVTIYKIHEAWVVRNPEDAANFAIRRLEKRKAEAEKAEATVEGAYDDVETAVKEAQEEAKQALTSAQGFERELERRQTGQGRPVSPEVAALSDNVLQHSLSLAKTTLRSQYTFYQEQSKQQAELAGRKEKIREVINAIAENIETMKLDLETTIKTWNLNLKTKFAYEQSAAVVDSPERRDYELGLKTLKDQANYFNGCVTVLMNRLDPTVQKFRMQKASNAIADEEFFRSWTEEAKSFLKPGAEQKLLAAAPSEAGIPEIERMLGTNPVRQPQPVPVRPKIVTGPSSSVDELLK